LLVQGTMDERSLHQAKVANEKIDAAEEEAVYEYPERKLTRHEEPELDHDLADRAHLFFRRMDTDRDKKIGVEDAKRGEAVLKEQMPDISVTDFIEFISQADHDHDAHLSRDEFMDALAKGLTPETPELIETQAAASTSRSKKARRTGFIGNFISAVGQNIKNKIKGAIDKITGNVDKSQDECVSCQYIVERIESNVKASGVINSMAATDPTYEDSQSSPQSSVPSLPSSLPSSQSLSQSQSQSLSLSQSVSFLEVESEKQNPFGRAGVTIINTAHASTRYQRLLERQRYNEIYRVADITLDDVCEQGMPTIFYGFCKALYKVQNDVVDGLRYQYRPPDICYRIGMCKKDSYITQGIHSRYKLYDN